MNLPRQPAPSDQLAERMIRLEEDAYREFTTEFGPRLRAYFRHRGMRSSQAEDLAVSCVTDIALAVETFAYRGPGSFERWVFTLAYRHFVDWLRKNRSHEARGRKSLEGLAFGDEVEPNHAVCEAVDAALRELPELDRRIIALRDLEQQLTYSEIGRVLDIQESTARVRHHRALKRLERVLAPHPAIKRLLQRRTATGQEPIEDA